MKLIQSPLLLVLTVVGKDTILVVYDRLSKITHFVAITEETLVKELVKELARLFRDNV